MTRVGIVQSISNRRGQVIAEVVLAITILLLLVVTGLLEFGRMMFVYNQMSNAARAGARWAAIQPDTGGPWKNGGDVASYLSSSGITVATIGTATTKGAVYVRLDVCNSPPACDWSGDGGSCSVSSGGGAAPAKGAYIRVRTCGSMSLMLPTIFGSIIGNPRQINGVAVFPYQAK